MAETCTCCSMSVQWWVRLRSHPELPICHDCLAGLNAQRDGQLQLASNRAVITGHEPIFRVADMAGSVAWYERAGFEITYHDDAYAFARRDRDLTIHLALAATGEPGGPASLYLHCRDADQLAGEWRQAGIDVDGPRHEAYGKREGSISDPDGNQIRFGS